MTVNIGPRRYLGASTFLGASELLGQGNTNTAKDIEWVLIFSTDDASVSIPSWVDISSYMRAFSTSRGRSSELSDVDAGTASITLDNRSRVFDPTNTSGAYYPNLRPMNRIWLRLRFNGLTHDVFTGYVESYEQQLPELGLDAVTVVHAADEFKVLALRNLPTTDPPRDTYGDCIQFDQPFAYWQMSDDPAGQGERATQGSSIAVTGGGMSATTDGAIIGENPNPYAALIVSTTQTVASDTITAGQDLNVGGLSAFTCECWVKIDSLPATTSHNFFAMSQFSLHVQLGNLVEFGVLDNTTTVHFVSSSVGPLFNQWAHVVGTLGGGVQRLYVNGVQTASAAFAGTIYNIDSTVLFGSATGEIANIYVDEAAIYRYTLSVDRIAAHYVAGTQRGFARSQLAGQRLGAVLDAVSNHSPRQLQAGTRPLAGQWTGNGQNTLETLREAENAEAVDAVLFIASDGTVAFLDGGYRSVSPWDTVQATFGDGGGSELDYMDIQLDYSDSFIANTWNITRDGGTTQTTSDAASITTYFERPQSLTGLKLRDDSDCQDVANEMTVKYSQPFTRVLSIQPKTMDVNVLDAVFQLELGDRIMVRNRARTGISSLFPSSATYPSSSTYPGPLMFEQTLFVQSITIDATPDAVFPTVKLGVSPV